MGIRPARYQLSVRLRAVAVAGLAVQQRKEENETQRHRGHREEKKREEMTCSRASGEAAEGRERNTETQRTQRREEGRTRIPATLSKTKGIAGTGLSSQCLYAARQNRMPVPGSQNWRSNRPTNPRPDRRRRPCRTASCRGHVSPGRRC
jgi:hypothetical protein